MGMGPRLICYPDEIYDCSPILLYSNAEPEKQPKFEAAGHAFHDAALRLAGLEDKKPGGDDGGVGFSGPNGDRSFSIDASESSYSSKARKKDGGKLKRQDHYSLLGLAHLRYLATEEQVRRSYRETALRHHPDKQAASLLAERSDAARQAKKEEIETHFKLIQEAYEVLIDPVRRRAYDSTDEFDDDVPTDCTPADFFPVFGPAFARNGRWSSLRPVPPLGDDSTPLADVDAFYSFWYGFRSWREFPHADEFDVEQAESREHRRWMERQNAKLSEKARKEEHARIRSLVDAAYGLDPRLSRRKEMLRAEKQRRKEARLLERRSREEREARDASEELRRREEEDRAAAEARRQRDRDKKVLRKERARLRNLSIGAGVGDAVESLCASLDVESLRELCGEIDGRDHDGIALVLTERRVGVAACSAVAAPASPVNGSVETEVREKPWGKEEIELLRKGVIRYPKGTPKRWEVVAEYIGTGRSVSEILQATRVLLLQKPDPAKAFDTFIEKRKPAALSAPPTVRDDGAGPTLFNGDVAPDDWSVTQEHALVHALKAFPKDTSSRWERISAAVPGKSVLQCKKRYTVLVAKFRSKNTAAT